MFTLAYLAALLAGSSDPQTTPLAPSEQVSSEQPAGSVDWDKEFGVERVDRDPVTGEVPIAPYEQSNANAQATPFSDAKLLAAFGGRTGIQRIANRLVELSEADPRISDVFKAKDTVRLKRTLFEQFCYIMGAGCDYTGRTMQAAHKDLGLQRADMNALVENLQQSMHEAKVPFSAQNRLLAKLAPMEREVVVR
ncbi:group I truncated hemoglobin [Novosphingobium ginsenosidimutans]|uniref:Group 1 truncated hemoglobin n=1 Tax=Novosphingobium ginsenosidimutans TaxID=1176536 RepID=A0A5B8S3B8_9SPHN|nr:group 1 truncated hemoglobin [Novosphingobium ginsenosidimutans]QEA15624.1 group 1 truncated hemoglobin [Novosphingobium ginsenosidimutans]